MALKDKTHEQRKEYYRSKGLTMFNIRIDTEILNEIRKEAVKNCRSINSEVNIRLKKSFKK